MPTLSFESLWGRYRSLQKWPKGQTVLARLEVLQQLEIDVLDASIALTKSEGVSLRKSPRRRQLDVLEKSVSGLSDQAFGLL